jgi:hypothetical protein
MTGASSTAGIRPAERPRLPWSSHQARALCCLTLPPWIPGSAGVTRAVAVAVPWSRSGQRSTSSSRPASAPVGNFSPSPASAGPPAASATARSWMPGLWAMSMADDTLLGRRRSRSRSCAAPATYSARSIRICKASPSAGRMAARVWRVRSDEEHNTTLGRTSEVARWAANKSAARRPRGARGRSGSGRPGSSQLDLAWRSNQRRFTVGQCSSSRSALGGPTVLGREHDAAIAWAAARTDTGTGRGRRGHVRRTTSRPPAAHRWPPASRSPGRSRPPPR